MKKHWKLWLLIGGGIYLAIALYRAIKNAPLTPQATAPSLFFTYAFNPFAS